MSLDKRGNMLIELVVALSIGLVVILQLTTFLVGFVQQMHGLVVNERRILQEGVAFDLLMLDLCVATQVSASNNGGVELQCWRMRDRENPRPIKIVWSRMHDQVRRRIDGTTPQVFGSFLKNLHFDMKKREVCFVDVQAKKRAFGF